MKFPSYLPGAGILLSPRRFALATAKVSMPANRRRGKSMAGESPSFRCRSSWPSKVAGSRPMNQITLPLNTTNGEFFRWMRPY